MLLFQQIEDLAYKHTDARRTIGEFLLAKKSRVREYNMQQIAEETFSSKSSLVRFAKAPTLTRTFRSSPAMTPKRSWCS